VLVSFLAGGQRGFVVRLTEEDCELRGGIHRRRPGLESVDSVRAEHWLSGGARLNRRARKGRLKRRLGESQRAGGG
jgi:hypothetical protein